MKVYNYTNNFSYLYISGDIHGEFRTLVYNIRCLEIKDAVIIVAGDCGIGFEKLGYYQQLYRKINKILDTNNCILLLVRGNHDDPSYFEGELINFPRMKTIPDYSIVKVASKTILCIGGAISLDRYDRLFQIEMRRITRKSEISIYWEDEFPIYKESEIDQISSQGIYIDTVITHTAPYFCYPQTKSSLTKRIINDADLERDVTNERQVISNIYYSLKRNNHKIKDWMYGHFHSSHTEFIDGVRFSLLDIEELKELLS